MKTSDMGAEPLLGQASYIGFDHVATFMKFAHFAPPPPPLNPPHDQNGTRRDTCP
eukprot:SAG11_NODE_1254_length_5378_cov_10.677780_2_plen_55_part_00